VCLAIETIAGAYPFVGPGSRLLCWLPLPNLFQRIVNLAGLRSGAASYLLGDPRRVMVVVAGVAPDVFVGVPRFYEKLHDGVRQRVTALPPWQRRLVGWAWEMGRRSSPYRQRREPMPAGLRLRWALADRLVLRRVRAVMGDRLRCMVTGSAPTPKWLLEEFHALGWLVLEAYGMSENVVPVAMNKIDDFRFGTVGRPLPLQQIAVADEAAILVRGHGLFGGYLGDCGPLAIDEEGFYQTGDYGEFDADGRLRLTGRSSELIKTSTGRRVAPGSAENLLRKVPGIQDAVLIGEGRKYLVALCTCERRICDDPYERTRVAQELRRQAASLNSNERPLGIVVIGRPLDVASGELTPNLKVRRAVVLRNHSPTLERLDTMIARSGQSDCEIPLMWTAQ
jgi:long-chain acyl-CoA synthetase